MGKCFVPSDALYQLAIDRGLNDANSDQIVMHGLPIRKGFWSSTTTNGNTSSSPSSSSSPAQKKNNWFDNILPSFGLPSSESTTKDDGSDGESSTISSSSIASLKEKLELNDSIPTILIVGGGDGIGKIVDITTALTSKLSSTPNNNKYQIVVVCGKNEKAQNELSSLNLSNSNLNVIIKGFVYNMEEYMKCSDILITKAGPGTIAEATICSLPCMLSSYLPGQEEGNVPFVIDNGFGDYSSNPSVIADTVYKWLLDDDDNNTLNKMKIAASNVSRPNATLDIANDLANIVFDYCDA